MDYGIIYFLLGQVKPTAYAYLEIRILQLAVPFAVLAECTHAQICLGISDGYRRFREFSVKYHAVKLPELFLDVCNISLHQFLITGIKVVLFSQRVRKGDSKFVPVIISM
jgi:hypothetical protein